MILNDSKFNRNWNVKKLNQLGEFKRGKSKHRPRNDEALFVGGKYPLIQTGEIKEANLYIRKHTDMYNDFGLKQSKLWRENTLCITIAANIAETALLGYPMCFPDSVVGFNAYPKESSELFMHYVFTYVKEAIQNSASGSIQDNINIEYLTGLTLRIPDKTYQDKIAAVLSALDAKIELNQRINAELESMAKTLYDYWFVQFEFPTPSAFGTSPKSDMKTLNNNKNILSDLGEAGRGYKSAGGKMVWNEALKREIPLAWEVGELGDIVNIYDSKRIPLSNVQREKIQGKYPYYGATSVMDYINDFIFDGEYILIAEDGSVMDEKGFPFVQYIWGKTWVNNHAHVLQPKDLSNYEYLFFLLKSISVVQIMTGSVQKKINQENLVGVKFATPDKKTLQLFSDFATPIRKRIINLVEETQTLTELRDWLLPLLMNGQVTIQTSEAPKSGETSEV